jgi:hypothetical protein
MERSARRVHAERDRRRLPQRGPVALWSRRVLGLLATAAFIGVGVVSAQMIIPDSGKKVIAEAPAATQTPTPKAKKSAKKKAVKKKAGLTKAQRAAREAAIKDMRGQGFTTTKLSDYDPKATLRVLIGRPVGDAAGGYQAFFFTKTGLIGRDAHQPSNQLKVAKKSKTAVTLRYGIYQSGDQPGSPSGSQDVKFVLVNGVLTPQDAIPLQGARYQRSSG